jgi:hypothetical protein
MVRAGKYEPGLGSNAGLALPTSATYEELMVGELDLPPGFLTLKEGGLAAKSKVHRR